MSSELFRSFIAFEIQDTSVLTKLASVQRSLVSEGADLRPVEPRNIHITLRFLGEVEKEMVNKVGTSLQEIRFNSFSIELKGLGAFPNLRRINVIWVGIERGLQELQRIFSEIEPRVRRLGFSPDDRGFNAHVTIARVRTGRGVDLLGPVIERFSGYEFGNVSADSLKLKRSILTPSGPVYSDLVSVHAVDLSSGA